MDASKLPLKLRQTRLGHLHHYLFGFLLIVVAVVVWAMLQYPWIAYVAAAIAFLGALTLGKAELHVRSHTLTVHHDKILVSEGILSKSESSAAFHNISDFATHQKLHERILGYGTLKINTSGGQHELEFEKLRKPHRVRDLLLELAHHHTVKVSSGSSEHHS